MVLSLGRWRFLTSPNPLSYFVFGIIGINDIKYTAAAESSLSDGTPSAPPCQWCVIEIDDRQWHHKSSYKYFILKNFKVAHTHWPDRRRCELRTFEQIWYSRYEIPHSRTFNLLFNMRKLGNTWRKRCAKSNWFTWATCAGCLDDFWVVCVWLCVSACESGCGNRFTRKRMVMRWRTRVASIEFIYRHFSEQILILLVIVDLCSSRNGSLDFIVSTIFHSTTTFRRPQKFNGTDTRSHFALHSCFSVSPIFFNFQWEWWK